MIDSHMFLKQLAAAFDHRTALFDEEHHVALRLFNGYYEGLSDMVIDLYGRTLVVFNHARIPNELDGVVDIAQNWLEKRLPWLNAIVIKERFAANLQSRRGRLVSGARADDRIYENGVWYAIDLVLSQDASFYLDTRNLRSWIKANLSDKTLLNTFAYTGSLGAAALAGGARRVVQTDLNGRYLELARHTCDLNAFPTGLIEFHKGDFFHEVGRFKQEKALFDCVILDPPFFSETGAGRVDLEKEYVQLINKVRPLVAHEGWLVIVNNALYVGGAAHLSMLQALCAGGYLCLEEILQVPEDVTGFPETQILPPPVDPAPFNHSTKISVLRVRRKDGLKG